MTPLPEAPRYARDRRIGGITRLSANELPHAPPAPIGAAMANHTAVNRYPDPTYATLFSALAEDTGVPHECVMVGAGSSSVLQRLIKVLCPDKGDAAMWVTPGFEPFNTFARQVGAVAQRVPHAPDGSIDLSEMLNAITPRTRVILLAIPHNPTGAVVSGDELRGFLGQIGNDITVVLDEAYGEFCDDSRVANGVELTRARWAAGHHNIAVVRTFSKAYGLAGLRVGYGIAPAPLARAVWDSAVPREIGGHAVAAAVAALKAAPAMRDNAARIAGERGRVIAELRRFGYAPPPSQANFIWLPLGDEAGRFAKHCLDGGVHVFEVAEHGVRVSIGTASDNDCFIRMAHSWATGQITT